MIFAKNYSVDFQSTVGFSSDFDAKLNAFNQIPAINGNVKISRQTIRTVRAEVSGPQYYAIALGMIYWDEANRA